MESRQKTGIKALLVLVLLAGTLLIIGCSKKEKTIGGVLIGAGLGAGIGAAAGDAGAAVAGGAIGGVAGGVIGHNMGDDK